MAVSKVGRKNTSRPLKDEFAEFPSAFQRCRIRSRPARSARTDSTPMRSWAPLSRVSLAVFVSGTFRTCRSLRMSEFCGASFVSEKPFVGGAGWRKRKSLLSIRYEKFPFRAISPAGPANYKSINGVPLNWSSDEMSVFLKCPFCLCADGFYILCCQLNTN